MTLHWYALQTNAQKEELVAQQLRARELVVFYPRLLVKPVNPRARTVRPFFPGYLFVQADLAEIGLLPFQHLPYAVGLVRFGGEPAEVAEELLEGVRARLQQINEAGGETFFRLKQGDTVLIEQGPFAGHEALFDARLRDSDRVRVLLELLGSQVPLTLAVGHIRPK